MLYFIIVKIKGTRQSILIVICNSEPLQDNSLKRFHAYVICIRALRVYLYVTVDRVQSRPRLIFGIADIKNLISF